MAAKRLLIALWAALLPAVEREELHQRLGYEVPVVPVSWALATVQVALIPMWAMRGIAYAEAFAQAAVKELVNTPLADLDNNAQAVLVGSPIYMLSYAFTLQGLAMEYAIVTGVFRAVSLAVSGRPVGDPLVSLVALAMRVSRSRLSESHRLKELGPKRPDRILQGEAGGLLVLSSREKPDWNERVTIQFGEDHYRLVRTEERPYGRWTHIAYVLRPEQPGEIIRGLPRLEGRVETRPPRRPKPGGKEPDEANQQS